MCDHKTGRNTRTSQNGDDHSRYQVTRSAPGDVSIRFPSPAGALEPSNSSVHVFSEQVFQRPGAVLSNSVLLIVVAVFLQQVGVLSPPPVSRCCILQLPIFTTPTLASNRGIVTSRETWGVWIFTVYCEICGYEVVH